MHGTSYWKRPELGRVNEHGSVVHNTSLNTIGETLTVVVYE
jgi:hypothetical protein